MGNFILVMGLSGSGKSHWISDIVEEGNTIILSSDALRKEFYGDERIQDNPAFIFEQMRIRTLRALKEGKKRCLRRDKSQFEASQSVVGAITQRCL